MDYALNKTVAVLLAGGSGSRMGADRPKQFLEVNGRTILEWSILAFSRVDEVDEVCIVCRKDWIEEVKNIVKNGNYCKVKHILPGGKERYDSSLSAIRAYEGEEVKLLLHDSVRCLVSERIIRDCIQALDNYEAVDVAIPATDTILQVNEEGLICQIPPRKSLRNVQTPQGFHLSTIRRAYEIALRDPNFTTTDDCGVVFRYLPDIPIKVIDGETTNIKVTYPQDLELVRKHTDSLNQ